jgi:hypothetical protein
MIGKVNRSTAGNYISPAVARRREDKGDEFSDYDVIDDQVALQLDDLDIESSNSDEPLEDPSRKQNQLPTDLQHGGWLRKCFCLLGVFMIFGFLYGYGDTNAIQNANELANSVSNLGGHVNTIGFF